MRRLQGVDVLTVTDVTGVGRPVLALFARHGLEPIAVTVMAGGRPTLAHGEYSIPKGDLISLLQIALHDGRLKIAAGLPDAGTLRAGVHRVAARCRDPRAAAARRSSGLFGRRQRAVLIARR